MVKSGTWVEIREIILRPEERTGNLPPETQRVPLEMRLKGFLLKEARLGEQVEIKTLTGRRVTGTLTRENPTYDYGYGKAFIPELLEIGITLRALLEDEHA